jgi:hypothetical protein
MFILKVIVSLILNVAIFDGRLFVPAGTVQWWCAWVFIGVVVVGTVAIMVSVFAGHEDLLNESFKPPIQPGQPLADKIVVLVFLATFVGVIVVIPPGRVPMAPDAQARTSRVIDGAGAGGCGVVDHLARLRRTPSRYRW